MNIQDRIRRLENQSGFSTDGVCHCEIGSFEIRTYMESTGIASQDAADRDARPNETCTVCGGEKRLIQVIYADHESVFREPASGLNPTAN